jgi:hypothetical protein
MGSWLAARLKRPAQFTEIVPVVREAGLNLIPENCLLFRKDVRHHWNTVPPEGIITDPEKLKDEQEWRTFNKHEIRNFFWAYEHIKDSLFCGLDNIAKPLTKETHAKQAYKWTAETEAAFQTLNEGLCTAPILAYPQPRDIFVVDTDESNVGIRGSLSQLQDGKERARAYYIKMLNKAGRNYCVTRREVLAIMTTLEHFQKYQSLRTEFRYVH